MRLGDHLRPGSIHDHQTRDHVRTIGRARLLDGAALAGDLLDLTRRRAADVATRRDRPPCLATVLIGDDPASAAYVRMKQRRCHETGIETRHVALPESTTTGEAAVVVEQLSADPTVDGILVQHPVPDRVDERAVFEAIAPLKDVDGVTLGSYAAMAFGTPGFDSCTPGGIMRLLAHHRIDVAGVDAVVLGRSPILGRPVAALLTGADATVTVCHSRTSDVASIVRRADLVVDAASAQVPTTRRP